MKVNTMIRSLKKTRYALLLLPFFQLSYANLTIETAKTIQGTKPRLSDKLENDLKNTGELKPLFGLRINNKNYYGEEEIANAPVRPNSPFYNQITAIVKQPDSTEYFDREGDELDFIAAEPAIDIVWYFTNAKNEEVEFKPKSTDTFCSLAEDKKYAPFKVKLSADLVLFSKFGDPDFTTYPNDVIENQPSATFTIVEDVGVCYAKPELRPGDVVDGGSIHFDKKNGFFTQSIEEPTKNFPTTGFYGARFELILSQKGIYDGYDWYVKQGSELVNIERDAKKANKPPIVVFNGESARDSKKAWDLIMGSSKGYPVIIEGKRKDTGKIIQYAFTITQWYESWQPIGSPAKVGTLSEVIGGCEGKEGHYRIAQADEISNAVLNSKGEGQFSREIGKLISEWGDVDQKSYPGSFGPSAGAVKKRFYVFDPNFVSDDNNEDGRYCDIHLNDGVYHCRNKENEHKNGVCASFKP